MGEAVTRATNHMVRRREYAIPHTSFSRRKKELKVE